MDPQQFTDETLMAYADGELDAATAREVEAAAEADPSVAQRLALFRETRDLLSHAAAARGTAPVSPALESRVRATLESGRRSATVTPLPQRRASWRPAAIAASIALVAGLAGGLVLRPQAGPEDRMTELVQLEETGISEALARLGSGEAGEVAAGRVTLVSSFRADAGGICREFELDSPAQSYVAVACHESGRWDLRFAMGRADGGEDYAPASSLEALDAWLDSVGAGPPLSGSDEAATLGALTD